jgi:hypothetical protein
MHNTLIEKLNEFKNTYGEEYASISYPNPGSTAPHRLKLVASIKVLHADNRQIEILQETKMWKKVGLAVVVSPSNQYLIDEMEELKKEADIWKPYS